MGQLKPIWLQLGQPKRLTAPLAKDGAKFSTFATTRLLKMNAEIVDNTDPRVTLKGEWITSNAVEGKFGGVDYIHDKNRSKGENQFVIPLTPKGKYRVLVYNRLNKDPLQRSSILWRVKKDIC